MQRYLIGVGVAALPVLPWLARAIDRDGIVIGAWYAPVHRRGPT